MRFMLAGTSSGCGKTTVTLALLTLLRQRGMHPAPFKSGPDYIDPGFHAFAAGRPSHNLDMFMMSERSLEQVLALGSEGADISVLEGAMSYYDGIGPQGDCSAHALAVATDTPVILVVDASGSASGAAATVLGFQLYRQPSRIAGVLVNRASSENHYRLIREAVEARTGLPCVGWMRRDRAIDLKSRHLGLIPAEELPELREKLERAAELLTIDMDALNRIASDAREPEPLPTATQSLFPKRRMGIARDNAFSFYYEANLEQLRRMGVELVPFSPLRDERLPDGLEALYLGGGFPEVFAEQLSRNTGMRSSIREALEKGLPCYAECGGMMYLGSAIGAHEMVGFLPIRCTMTERLQRFGYVYVTERLSGLRFPAHEFHHSLESGDEGLERVYDIVKAADPTGAWQGGYRRANTLAGYPHIHFWDRPELVRLLWGSDGARV